MDNDCHTGQCLCGAIKFELSGKVLWVSHCHCLSCRRNTGAAVATFVGLNTEQLSYTSGTVKTFKSSVGVRRKFCADCGTPMSYEAASHPGEIHIYISTLEQPALFPPTKHTYFEERIAWFDVNDTLPRYATSSRSAGPICLGPHTPLDKC